VIERSISSSTAACFMPLKYEALVGDMGSVLSGGQRQRVLLARALYSRPSILFIDEGTANLDPRSEAAVMETLDRSPTTRILCAHRLAAIRSAHRIIVVADGQVKELPPLRKPLSHRDNVNGDASHAAANHL
jgi:ATP-binding cassette subfamily B protein RaxB